MGSSLLNIAVTGLNAAQGNLQTVSHNIANSSTPGFNRQSIIQSTQTPQLTGSGFLGQGTSITNVVRAYSVFMSEQVSTAQARSSQLQTYADQIGQVENLIADPTVGLSPAITTFFDAINGVSANPSSTAARQSVLSSAQSLVSRFQDLNQQLTQINDGVNGQLASETANINSLAVQIADLNQRIGTAEAGAIQQANDLRDQRDQLVAELNSHIAASVVTQSDGSYSVFIGSGQPLVVESTSFTLNAVPSSTDPERTTISLTTPNGKTAEIPESLLSGGALGGLLQFRSETLDGTRNALGQIAAAFADTFNTQHRLGQDLSGAMGGDFFKAPVPVVIPAGNNPPPASGTGVVSASISDASALTTSDYLLTNTVNGVSLTRLSDNKVLASNTKLPITVDGITINVSGTLAAGESFRIEPTKFAARDIAVAITDVRSIAAGVPVTASAGVANTGTVKISSGALVAPITLTYSGAQQGYTGFPAGTTLSIWDGTTTTTQTVSSQSQAVQIPTGANVSVNGITFQINGAPTNGDSFEIGPNQLQTSITNVGAAAIAPGGRIGSTTFTYSAATNDLSLTPTPSPLLNTTVSVTNAGVTTQYPIRLPTDTVPYIAGATYRYNGIAFTLGGAAPANGDTFTVGASASLATGAGNTGTGTITSLPLSSGASLPSKPTTFTYTAGTNTLALTPVPGGGTVTVTAGNSTNSYAATGNIPFVAGATYSYAGVNFKLGGTPANADTFIVGQSPSTTSATGATISEQATTFSASLPTSPYSLSYDSANNILTGFPVGTTVAVTANGTTTEVPITTPNAGVAFTSGMMITVNGVSVTLTGIPKNGDTFTVAPTTAGTTDNRNMQLLSRLQTVKTMLGGTATYEGSYAQFVSTVGNKGNEVKVMNEAQQAQLKQFVANQQSFSGVNLDEEAANLIRFQQQYQAAAKVIGIADKLFELLTNL